MGTETLVENHIRDGRKLITLLAKSQFDVTAACWIKTSDEGKRLLYIVSKTVDEKGLAAAYGELYGALDSMHTPWISMFEVKLVGTSGPIAAQLLWFQHRFQDRFPTRYSGPLLGNIAIEEAFIYPPMPKLQEGSPLTPREVVDKSVQLMRDSENTQPSAVTLQDGSSFLGLPIGLELGRAQQ